MSKSLVLAEKPSVGRELARVLNCSKKGNGSFEGNKYIVTWALGHLVTLAAPEVYDKKYANWNMEDLPMLPDRLGLVVIKKTSKQFNTVKSLMHRKDVSEIIIATDAGREGELVARWIIQKAKVNKPIKRLWISSVTDKAIRDGFNNLKNGKDYENLYASAQARAEADWIVGLNATRGLTCKHNAQLSCGRVQSPTLAMINEREEEIRTFRPKDYFGITCSTDKLKFTWKDNKSGSTSSFNEERIDKIIKGLNGEKLEIVNIKKAHKKTYAPRLYDLTELQRDANKIFGYSAKETLSITQRLYENYKVLTYPRTDSRYITDDMVPTLKDRIKACMIRPYSEFASKLYRKNLKASKSFVDNKKVTDHHAIIPTEETPYLGEFSDKERKIYDLVVKRFLAVLSDPFEYEQISVEAKVGTENFAAKGKSILKNGWKEIYSNRYDDEDEDSIKEQHIPNIKEGQSLRINRISKTKGATNPPPRFNEGSLLSAMENPAKFMAGENKELIKTLGKTGGIGTVATRADIIEKLFNSYLIEKKGKDIHITSKGRQLLVLVPKDLKSAALTAKWEQKLESISKGKMKKNNFISEMKDYTKEIIKDIKTGEGKFKHDNMTRTKCPECGKYLLEVKNKRGKMLVCQDRECGYKKGISKVTNARCPNCHKKMELRGQGEGQIFVCPCGHRERMSAFKKRKDEKKKQGSKRDVGNYLKKQQKNNEPINTALADALAKLKF
ncbi:MAG: DNA topoisomerase III [Anaeromicrobium sp.]|jgi:DNA topoisomerase-3|uniref:DNA topoisomerase III n=1 Tax=Anaeromicrobium sp. TaxID=1929132 RepID=UPI0025DF5CB0|nr:DNA topoisomerase III [Anaeromicrobium sp.]MCT4595315.1 DNA topoisomerase III [Anaeromicrobium sp.]